MIQINTMGQLMTELVISKRRFLIGLTAAVVAMPAARILQAAPALASISPHGRSAYGFRTLPDPKSKLPVEKQLIDVVIDRYGRTYFIQIESGRFPTSYILTTHKPMLREAEGFSSKLQYDPLTKMSHWDSTMGGTVSRTTNAYLVEDGQLKTYGPNEVRATSEGILVEEARTNHVTHSAEAWWLTQTVRLAPGEHQVSWYGPGHIKISGECVALERRLVLS